MSKKYKFSKITIFLEIIPPGKFLDFKFFYNDSVKLVILKFHENGHTKYKRFLINSTPRYFYKDNLECVDNIKKTKNIITINGIQVNEYIGESGNAVEIYLFDDHDLANKILYSQRLDLKDLYNHELYVKPDFNELNSIIKKYNFKKENDSNLYQEKQSKKGEEIKIPKLKFRKGEKARMFTYIDLGVDCNDLLI